MDNLFFEILSKLLESSLSNEYLYVEDLHINNNVVRGDIFSMNNSEHSIITFKTFTDDEIRKLKEITNDDNIKLQIIQNKIPDELWDCGINIMPNSPNDFEDECSCVYDGDGFCPHVNKLLKDLNRDIEDNPFIIFSIKGFDLKKLCKVPVKSIDELFSHNYKSSKNIIIHNLFDVHMLFLNDKHFSNDFLGCIYDELFSDLIEYIDDLKPVESVQRMVNLNIGSNYQITNIGKVNDELSLFKYLINLMDSDTFWGELIRLTLKLLKNNAIMPELFKISQDKFSIRWIPAFFDSNVLALTESYYSKCPEDLITYDGKNISKENQVIIAISLIIKGYINYYFENFGWGEIKTIMPPLVFELFFEDFIEANSYKRINMISDVAWKLSAYQINELSSKFLLSFEKNDDEFLLDLKIKKDGEFVSIDNADITQSLYASSIYKILDNNLTKINEFSTVVLSKKKFLQFNREIKELLEFVGIECSIPFNMVEGDLKLKLDVEIDGDDYFTLNDLNRFKWMINIGADDITIEEFEKISKNSNELLKVNDKFYAVDKNKLSIFKNDLLFLPRDFTAFELLQISLLGRYRNFKFEINDKFKKLINFSSKYDAPDNLVGKLRPYQEIGFSWMVQNIKSGFGSILADDMGLGKTIQVLATILYLKENNQLNQQVLIIAPTTLLSNWESEIQKFTPTLSYSVYHGAGRDEIEGDVDMILTSFGIIRHDLEKFLKKDWFLCVVDEAQNIKNPKTKQTKAIKSIKSLNRIALTGTPIENRLLDYWSIFDFTNPGYLNSQNEFKNIYVKPIEKNNSNALDNLKAITKPFILRRLKTDKEIIKELPEKNVNDIFCSLSKKQQKLYDKVLNDDLTSLKGSSGIERRGNILKLITSLKQICNHPSQFKKSKKINVTDSGKAELLMDVLDNILEVGEKVIIFTQYVQMGELLEQLILKNFNREVLFLHGSLSREKRNDLLYKFQNESAYPILIATLKTGGVGLNLTAAQNVIHYDLWWNPAVENQATDRVYRIGQNEDVMVYRFITKGTLEEQIDSMIKDKLELAGKAIDSQETFITEMSDEELLEMLSLRL